ncbi:hypothetical protein F4820DRAFT_449256 [Hypoxylon rubiginosum]|uniref:Uncharacterized protein n=1 Tax=Hypoxylon rubiginosum TaxID=110542 RepID=A0ACB9YXH6_9PEZI|nr:hypothetical protein F4820DRAFT_449256 [Hypoxylon rubiginosum]
MSSSKAGSNMKSEDLTDYNTVQLQQIYPQLETNVASTVAKVDIIAVHGLAPPDKDSLDTWRTPSGPAGRLWLRDDLPRFLPESRIFLYKYNATVVYGQDRDTFVGKANEFLEQIRIERDEVESRPIIFLGHGMGGVFIKQALINAQNNPKYTPIKNAASGLAFFATPHSGEVGMLAAKMATAVGFKKGNNVVKVLKNGTMFPDSMDEAWRHQVLDYNIVSFWGASDNVVPRGSAHLNLPGNRENIVKLEADHSGVCKFGESQTDQDNLKLVRVNLQDLYKATRTCNKHLLTHYIPLARNDRFTGRDDILDELEEKLFVGRECQRLVVFGLGGVDKTQLALQFAYWVKDNQPEYSVFWVPALSTRIKILMTNYN